MFVRTVKFEKGVSTLSTIKAMIIFNRGMVYLFSSTATWPIECPPEEAQGYHLIRIKQNGPNASGQTHYLSMSGFEIYGTVTGVTETLKGIITCH